MVIHTAAFKTQIKADAVSLPNLEVSQMDRHDLPLKCLLDIHRMGLRLQNSPANARSRCILRGCHLLARTQPSIKCNKSLFVVRQACSHSDDRKVLQWHDFGKAKALQS